MKYLTFSSLISLLPLALALEPSVRISSLPDPPFKSISLTTLNQLISYFAQTNDLQNLQENVQNSLLGLNDDGSVQWDQRNKGGATVLVVDYTEDGGRSQSVSVPT
jgi:hypothetical protein